MKPEIVFPDTSTVDYGDMASPLSARSHLTSRAILREGKGIPCDFLQDLYYLYVKGSENEHNKRY